MRLAAGTVKRIHVDRLKIALNRRDGGDRPVMTIQTSKGSIKCHRVEVIGRLVFDQRAKQLSCGARLYGETRSEVIYR